MTTKPLRMLPAIAFALACAAPHAQASAIAGSMLNLFVVIGPLLWMRG
jgi:hypothetical protein